MAQTNLLHFILTILHGFIEFYCLLDFRVYNLLKTSCKNHKQFSPNNSRSLEIDYIELSFAKLST